MTPIISLPNNRKPRERLFQQGVEALSAEELVAIILGTGARGRDVLSLSSAVVSYLGQGKPTPQGLSGLFGIGAAKSAEIIAAMQLSTTLARQVVPPALSDPASIYSACHDLVGMPQEHLAVFYLTVRNRQIAREIVSIGTASASLLHPREVFRPAILHNASHIALAHNHPSGECLPSQADREGTVQMVRAGRHLGIEVLDHVVCGALGYMSLRVLAPELFF